MWNHFWPNKWVFSFPMKRINWIFYFYKTSVRQLFYRNRTSCYDPKLPRKRLKVFANSSGLKITFKFIKLLDHLWIENCVVNCQDLFGSVLCNRVYIHKSIGAFLPLKTYSLITELKIESWKIGLFECLSWISDNRDELMETVNQLYTYKSNEHVLSIRLY